MKRLEFLKKSLSWGIYRKKAWMISAFSVFREPENEWKKSPYPGRIVSQPWGYDFVNEKGELEKIEDSKAGAPIFAMNEVIDIDPTWIINLKEPVQTYIGSLFANQIMLVENFGSKIPYIPSGMTIRKIEDFVINNKSDKEIDTEKITLKEYLNMAKSVEYLKTLSNLSVYSVTKKNITPPPGLKEFKAKLLEEYQGQLEDPVKLAEFEKKLLDFAQLYIQDDPTWGKLVSGKVFKNGYRKMFLSSGAEGGLKGDMVPITESLVEGVPLEPKKFAATVNGARSGSYYRGKDTVKGGVSAKIAIRALSSFSVKEGDCGTLMGLPRLYTKHTISNLVGRQLAGVSDGKVIENINEAGNYLGKIVKIRSTMYCQYPGQTYCETCAGKRLSRFKDGLSIPATDMTSAILAASMAAMHKNTTTTVKLDLTTTLS